MARKAKPAPPAEEPKQGNRKQAKPAEPEKGKRKQQKAAEPAKRKQAEPAARKERRQLTTAEWRKIRLEYVRGKTTYRQLAEKWGMSESWIRKKASIEGWKKRKHKLDTNIEQKVLERVCDARAREFEIIARVNDNLGTILDNMLDFVRQQPPKRYDDMRGIESLSKAIYQVVQTKRDLYNLPNEAEKAKIDALREKNRLEREKWQTEQQEKAASRAIAENTMWKLELPDEEKAALDE